MWVCALVCRSVCLSACLASQTRHTDKHIPTHMYVYIAFVAILNCHLFQNANAYYSKRLFGHCSKFGRIFQCVFSADNHIRARLRKFSRLLFQQTITSGPGSEDLFSVLFQRTIISGASVCLLFHGFRCVLCESCDLAIAFPSNCVVFCLMCVVTFCGLCGISNTGVPKAC